MTYACATPNNSTTVWLSCSTHLRSEWILAKNRWSSMTILVELAAAAVAGLVIAPCMRFGLDIVMCIWTLDDIGLCENMALYDLYGTRPLIPFDWGKSWYSSGFWGSIFRPMTHMLWCKAFEHGIWPRRWLRPLWKDWAQWLVECWAAFPMWQWLGASASSCRQLHPMSSE